MVDLLIWVWGGYSAEADPAHSLDGPGGRNGEWLKYNARLGKALRLPLNLLFGLRVTMWEEMAPYLVLSILLMVYLEEPFWSVAYLVTTLVLRPADDDEAD